MNIKIILFVFGLLSFNIFSNCPLKGNVYEYYVSIAQEKFEVFHDSNGRLTLEKDLKNVVSVLDKKNGYLELNRSELVNEITFALFKKKENNVLAITSDGTSVQNQYAYECVKGKWIDVSKVFYVTLSSEGIAKYYQKHGMKYQGKDIVAKDIEKLAHSSFRFKLPRYGRNIEVYSSFPDLSKVTFFKYIPFNLR